MNLTTCLPLMLLATLTQAALSPASFPFARPLIPPAAALNEVGAFVPDGAVYEALDARFANLRLFDTSGRETPILIRHKIPRCTVDQLFPFTSTLTVKSLREEADNRLELTVTRHPQQPEPAALEFSSALRNFEKMVTVWNSHDGQSWIELARDEPIYDYSRFADMRRTRIPLASGNGTLYRIRISNITEKKDSPLVEIIRQTRGNRESNETEATSFLKEPFRIDRLMFYERRAVLIEGIVQTAELAIKDTTTIQDDKQRQTVISFSTRNEPLAALTVATGDANFSREATLEGRTDGPPATWQTVASGRLTRVRIGKIGEEQLTLNFPAEVRYRSYRLILHNQDNPPLAVTGLRVRQNLYEILFLPKPGQTYRLTWGGEGFAVPQYDIGSVLAAVPAGAADAWQLGETVCAPAQPACRSWSAYSRKIMIGALVVMAGILLVVVIRLAGKVDLQ
jgi:hypothetical protein